MYLLAPLRQHFVEPLFGATTAVFGKVFLHDWHIQTKMFAHFSLKISSNSLNIECL